MTQSIINREVGEQSKGFRLQKLRAIKLILDQMENRSGASVYVAVEYLDDVYIKSIEGDHVEEYIEGDKNYAPNSSFTFMSQEVRNSLISFLDCWIQGQMSQITYFGFYTNIRYGKEKQTDNTKRIGINLPDEPILRKIINADYKQDKSLINLIKEILIEEYRAQYARNNKQGNISAIVAFGDDIWIEFLDRIKWQFGCLDDVELEQILIKQIRDSRLYDGINITGKEKYILGALEQLVEKRQKMKDPVAKLISQSDVKVIFLELASGIIKRSDPVHEIWDSMPPPNDKRNIREKILDVCNLYKSTGLDRIDRRVASVRSELNRVDSKDRSSYRYQIFDSCEEQLYKLIEKSGSEINQEIIDQWFEILYETARKRIEDKSQDYAYSLANHDTLKSAVLELFDSCYLAFDSKEE